MPSQFSNRQLAIAFAAVTLVAGAAGFGISQLVAPPVPSSSPEPVVSEPGGPQEIEVSAERITSAGIAVEPVGAGSFSGEILAPAVASSGSS